MKTFFILCIAVSLSARLLAQTGKIDSTEMITLRLDPQSARGASVSQLFSEVEFIPLETTKESLFGAINELKVVKDRFVIYDYNTRAVLIFDNQGKFIQKIDANKISVSNEDKTKESFYGFRVHEENNENFILIFTEKYCYYYNLDGKQVKRLLNKDANVRTEYELDGQNVLIRPNFVGKDSTFFEFGLFRKGSDSTGFFPYDRDRYSKDEYAGRSDFHEYGVPGELLFTRVYSYNLYKITPSKVSLAYRAIFPAKNSLPLDFMTNPVYVKKRLEYFTKNPSVFYGIASSYLLGSNLYLQMRNFGWEQTEKKSLIYNLKSGELLSTQDIEPDTLSSFLPITDAGAFSDFSNAGFHLFKSGYLYTSYSSLALFTFKEQMGDRKVTFPPLLQNHFKTQNKKSNPVIILLKPKID